MVYKTLVSGKNYTLVKDFLQYTYNYFKCLSTTDCWHDIDGHFELFDPDVFVYFMGSDIDETADLIFKIKRLSDLPEEKDVIIVLISSVDNCAAVEAKYPYLADVLITRPVSADNIALRIIKFLEKKQEAEEQKKAKIAEREAQEKAAELEAKRQEEAAELEAKRQEEARAAELALEAEIEKVNARKHILIVDDDRNILKMLKSALSDNYDVTTIINGSLVEKIIETKKVDLIILDYEMPIETGKDIFIRIKKKPLAKDIPVCFLTGVNEREKIQEVMSLSPDGYLLKPVNMDMLKSTIINLTS